jgi:ABC-type nitrate/sulfonate/bicarbonate transport system permease component
VIRRAVPILAGMVGLIVAWQLYCDVSGVSPLLLPSPIRIASALVDARDEATQHASTTFAEALVGFAIAVGAACVVAVAMDRVAALRRSVYPILVGSQAVPILAITPLLVLWFGFGLLPKVIVIVLVTFFPITVALLDGFASTTAEATDLLRTMGASSRQAFWKLRLPSALPGFFTGLRISVTYAVIGAVYGEYIGAFDGLGIWMRISANLFRTDLVFAAIGIVVFMSVAMFAVVVFLEAITIPWYRASRRAR